MGKRNSGITHGEDHVGRVITFIHGDQEEDFKVEQWVPKDKCYIAVGPIERRGEFEDHPIRAWKGVLPKCSSNKIAIMTSLFQEGRARWKDEGR